MTCAISVPDEVFAAADEQAARMGISRSEFFAVGPERRSVVMFDGMTTVDKAIFGPVVGDLPLILWQEVLRAIDLVVGRVKGLA